MSDPVYLGHNATTPVDPRVTEAAMPYWTEFFGNPSSDHPYAEQPRRALAAARRAVAELVGARPGEVVFTASPDGGLDHGCQQRDRCAATDP
ncbi:aminotransferase class V-fold PLP-dependent enzyme [Amycolatopsis sp. NPDC051045]|uniref:aminotransferase class V-fold PLP-dependent enzyme n=1 Tax=Amycolatopsis sp. NPDC051045 TaxID=3156922 RepID=UPI00341AAB09